jgi:hypothetical protein
MLRRRKMPDPDLKFTSDQATVIAAPERRSTNASELSKRLS